MKKEDRMNKPYDTWKEKAANTLSFSENSSGKKHARKRLELLLDSDSFEEVDLFARSSLTAGGPYSDGVICGFGTINQRVVAVYAQDFSIKGGSLGKRHGEKICKIMDMAAKIGCPIIGILDSGGARIDEGIHALAGYGEIFMRNVRYSGIIPQISLVLGPCAGGAAYSPALTDFIITVEGISQLFITGPQVIKQVLHEDISKEELGGSFVHATKSGLVHHVCESEEEAFFSLKRLLFFLPNNYKEDPLRSDEISVSKTHEDLPFIVPDNMHKSYDIKAVINAIVDSDTFFEIQPLFAPNLVVGFARCGGYTVAIVANQALCKAGTLDIDASSKGARFIKTCNNFNIPIISLVDVPGFLPGIAQEHNGIIRHGAKLLYAYAQATVPKITVIMRKAFGGAYIVMGSKHLGADFVFAWPGAHIAVLGASSAIAILNKKELDSITTFDERKKRENELIDDYEQKFLNPFIAAESGYIDAIIEPEKTRFHLIRALEITAQKVEMLPGKKHGNIPL